jgi:hypothetical protein
VAVLGVLKHRLATVAARTINDTITSRLTSQKASSGRAESECDQQGEKVATMTGLK